MLFSSIIVVSSVLNFLTILDNVNHLNIKELCDRNTGIGADGLINIDSYYNVSFYNAS